MPSLEDYWVGKSDNWVGKSFIFSCPFKSDGRKGGFLLSR